MKSFSRQRCCVKTRGGRIENLTRLLDRVTAMTISSTNSVDEKREAEEPVDVKPTVGINEVDTAAQITAGKHVSFTPEDAERVRCVSTLSAMIMAV